MQKEPRGKNRPSIRTNFITLLSLLPPPPPPSPSYARPTSRALGSHSLPSSFLTRGEVPALSPVLNRRLPRTIPITSLHRFTLRASIAFVSNPVLLQPPSYRRHRPFLLCPSFFFCFFLYPLSRLFPSPGRPLARFLVLLMCPFRSSFYPSSSFSLYSRFSASLTGCFPSARSSLKLVPFDCILCAEQPPRWIERGCFILHFIISGIELK